jgi:hypothetical protein
MGDFPISRGGGQFTFVPLTLWYKFATRGCRWICYSNLRSNRSKVQTSNEFLFAFRLENANKKSFEVWTLLRLRNSCPAVPTWGGGILYTEFIQICTIFDVDFDRKHHIHLNSLVFQTKFVSTGKCEKYRFHGESSQNWRVHVLCSPRFELPKVARPIRVPVRVTPCGRMPQRGPRAPPAI